MAVTSRSSALITVFLVLVSTADALNVTIAYTTAIRGRLFQYGKYGGDCKQDLYNCCDPVPGCGGGMARVAHVVKELRRERRPGSVIMLDGGEQVGETSAWQTFRGSMMRNMMLQIGYTAKGVATNELYVGPNNLAEFARDQDQFTLLGANINADSEHQLGELIQQHIVKDANGVLVGITSISVEHMCVSTSCSVNGKPIVTLSGARQALTTSVGYMLNRGANIIVVICAGYDVSDVQALAGHVSHVNMFIVSPDSTVSDEILERGFTTTTSPLGQEVLIVTSYEHGGGVGYVDFDVNELTRKIDHQNASHVILNEEVPFDNATSAILRAAEELSMQAREVGVSMAEFLCPDNPEAAQIDASRCSRFGESHVGNLVADAILAYGRGLGATVGLMNGGGIRQNLDEGNITDKDCKAVLPFANVISVVSVTGQTLGEALNNSLSRLGGQKHGTGRFLQVAGVRMKFDLNRNPNGRVFDVETENADGTWSPLAQDDVYKVALPDFIRNGGDGYDVLANNVLDFRDHGPSLSGNLINYLEHHNPRQPGVRPLLHGRIVNATEGHDAQDIYACVSSRSIAEDSERLSDDCLNSDNERSYTRISWRIEPSSQSHVAFLLRLRLDHRWLQEFNTSLAQPAGKGVTERFEVIPGDYVQSGGQLGFDYAYSGIQFLLALNEPAGVGSKLYEGGVLEHSLVISSDAVAIEVESARPMAAWQKLTVSFEALNACPPGYMLDNNIGTGIRGCSQCAPGLYSNVSGGDCLSCPRGTSNKFSGQPECSPCAEGMYQPYVGQLQCQVCQGTISADATKCVTPSEWPVYAYVLLPLMSSALLVLLVLAGYRIWSFGTLKERGLGNYFIKFEELEFDHPPHVLGTGSLGLVLAAKYRSLPVAVKQIQQEQRNINSNLFEKQIADGLTGSSTYLLNPGLLDQHSTTSATSPMDASDSDPMLPIATASESTSGIVEYGRRNTEYSTMAAGFHEAMFMATVLKMAGHNASEAMLNIDTSCASISLRQLPLDISCPNITENAENVPSPIDARWASIKDSVSIAIDSDIQEVPFDSHSSRQNKKPLARPSADDKYESPFLVDLSAEASHPRSRQSDTAESVMSKLRIPYKALQALFAMRHPHVVTMMGITSARDESLCLVMERLDQGSLHDILHNPMIFLDAPTTFGLMRNIVQGMSYMHVAQPPFIHCLLKASNVVVDSKFTAKISDFGLAELIGPAALRGSSFWIAPEVLCGEPCSTASDVYAFAITMYELWTRLEPYQGEDLDGVVRDVARPPPTAMRVIWKRPVLPEGHTVPQFVLDLIEKCWHQDPAQRPTFQQISGFLDEMEPSVSRSSRHLQNSPSFGEDRKLLEQILPPHVAKLLKDGKEVPPEQHRMVTLMFTDIVGFTDISSTLKPEQVMDMLDRLYTAFDELTDKYDLFKVETIGDAYMVVANLHKKHEDHTHRMCRFALDAIEAAKGIEIVVGGGLGPNGEEWGNIRIRAGIHCGPVVASVVGKLNPRYCLFGDTVNTAARMESNSAAMRAHLSLTAAGRLMKQAPNSKIEKRGNMEIKGKGLMKTYWLLDCPAPQDLVNEDGRISDMSTFTYSRCDTLFYAGLSDDDDDDDALPAGGVSVGNPSQLPLDPHRPVDDE